MSELPTSFLDSAFRTKVEYEESLKLPPAERAAAERAAAAKHASATVDVSAGEDDEKSSFIWGGTRARPRKKITRQLKSGAIFLKPPGSCLSKFPGACVTVECCENCSIYVLDPCEQVILSECFGCRIVVGPCVGSVMLTDCTDCTVTVAAKETRMAACSKCEVRVYAPTRKCVRIEDCTGLRFGAWDVAYPGLTQQFVTVCQKLRIAEPRNYWNVIMDGTPAKPGSLPNYEWLPPAHPQGRWCQLALEPTGFNGGTVTETRGNLGKVAGCECPVPSQDGSRFQLVVVAS